MYIKAKYNNLIRPYMRTVKQGFGSLYGGNQTSVIIPAEANIEGQELITNGDLATNSNWILTSGVTYNSNGYIDFDGTQTGLVRNTPDIDFIEGKTYKVVYEIKNYVSGDIKFRFQNGINTLGTNQNGNGVKTEYVNCLDSRNNNFQFRTNNFIGSIDNISVKEITTRTNERTIENENESNFPN